MKWNKGFTASYYAYILDPQSFREVSRLEITGGTVKHESSGLRESADIDVVGYNGTEAWVRIYLDARQNGSASHIPLFTGLGCSPGRDIDGVIETSTLQCYSVLKPAQDVLLERGYYVLRGANGAAVAKDLLSVGPAPVKIMAESPVISDTLIAEDGESCLTMAEAIISAINWQITIGGDGTIYLGPRADDTAKAVFDPLDNDAIEPQISVERDWYECPNVLRAVSGDLMAIARDDDPGSPLSTVSRGREIWAEDSASNLGSEEGIAEYARRRLTELQSVALTASYKRRYRPDIGVGDLVRLHYPKQKLDGLFRVDSQSIDLTHGATTDEEVTCYEQGE